jgi:hypothetical protein
MKELRELYDKGTQGEWCSLHHYNDVFVAENTSVCTTQNGDDADLIAAMHNDLPELLDAWEMVQAMEWASQSTGWGKHCLDCSMKNVCLDDGSELGICEKPFNEGRDRLLTAWREAQKIQGVE